jgi:hypothetical protein
MKIAANGQLATLATAYTWSEVEPVLAIICACLVTYRPLFTNLNLDLSKIWSNFSKGSYGRSRPDGQEESFGNGSDSQ